MSHYGTNRKEQILNFAYEKGIFTLKDIMNELNLPYVITRNELLELKELGWLVSVNNTGISENAKYKLSEKRPA